MILGSPEGKKSVLIRPLLILANNAKAETTNNPNKDATNHPGRFPFNAQ